MSVRQSWCIWRMRAAPIFQQFVILLWLCGSHISLRILVLCKCHTQSVVIRDGSCESESCSAWEHRWYDLLKQVFWPVVKRTMFWFEPQFVTFVWSEFNWILPLFFFFALCLCTVSVYCNIESKHRVPREAAFQLMSFIFIKQAFNMYFDDCCYYMCHFVCI